MPSVARVSAVSYLNTCPLVWGFIYGPQAGTIDLRFELPAGCSESLKSGTVDIGLVPAIEAFRQGLEPVADVCISSDGPVRSIFLAHRKPLREIRSVAMDSSSRTSAALARILLAERFGIRPIEHQAAPDLTAMLKVSDAALIIGDPALRLALEGSEFEVWDLGAEWKTLTGLPMVYAIWAGRADSVSLPVSGLFRGSYDWSRGRIEEIIRKEAPHRAIPGALAEVYLTHHIKYDLDERAHEGMKQFQLLARKHGLL